MFVVNYSQFQCAHLFENIFIRNLVFLHEQIMNQTVIVTRLQLIRIKTTKLVYIGRQR